MTAKVILLDKWKAEHAPNLAESAIRCALAWQDLWIRIVLMQLRNR
jgi:hypothetical protein